MAIRHQVIKPASAAAEYIHPTFTLSNLWTAPYAIWWYIGHLIFPWGLAVEYAAKVVERPTLLGFASPAVCLLLLLVAAWWTWRRQRSKMAAFLIFWFVLTLAPAVIVAPMVLQHDRYLHIPSYAFCALVAWAILHLGNVQVGSLRIKTSVAVALCVVALWTGLSWHEMGFWDCETTLWSRVLQISPSEPKAQIQLAYIYQEAGDTPRALAILNDGLHYRPDSPNLWLVRARIMYDDKRWDEARAAFLKVLQVTEPAPGRAVSAGTLTRLRSDAAYHLALMDFAASNFQEAERDVRLALSLDAKGVGYHSTLSRCLRSEGRVEEAKAENALELRLRLAQQAAHP
jgi:tetratricopeptide (TPR) repeat protein